MARRPKIRDLKASTTSKILCLMHYHYANSDVRGMSRQEIHDAFRHIGKNVLNDCINELMGDQLVDRISDLYTLSSVLTNAPDTSPAPELVISQLGIDTVDDWDDQYYDQISEGIPLLSPKPSSGTTPIPLIGSINGKATDSTMNFEIIDSNDLHNANIPASDRTVPLTHNSAEHVAAKDAVDILITELKKTNDIGDIPEEEWEQHVHEIKAGRIMLESPQISVELMEKCLMAPIKFFADRIASGAIGHYAAEALKALAALF